VRAETAVDDSTALRLARASVRYRLTSPAIYLALLLELGIAFALWAAGRPWWGLAVAACAVTIPVALGLQTASLARTLQRRGYRPGTTMTVDWDDEAFTVTTPTGRGVYRYAAVASARRVGDVVVARIHGVRVLVVLPAEVVPDSARAHLPLRG
jgi:hypothetical protein